VIIAAVVGAWIAGTACAQRLDLGAGVFDRPETERAVEELERRAERLLEAELRAYAPIIEDEPVPPLPDPEGLKPTVRLELRRLVVTLIERGGDQDLVTARTVLRHLGTLDEVEHAEVATALRALVAGLPAKGAAFERAIRQAFAPLTDERRVEGVGWVWKTGVDPEAEIAGIDERPPALAHTGLAAARAFGGDEVPSHLRPAAGALRVRADRVLELFRPMPEWLDGEVAEEVAGTLVRSLADAALHDPEAGARLGRLMRIAETARALDTLPRSREAADARRLFNKAVLDPAYTDAALPPIARLARLLAIEEPAAERDDLVRHLRPAWPRALDQRRRARERLEDLLPRTLLMDRPAAEPSFLAVLIDAEEAEARIARLGVLSLVLCDGEIPEPPRRPEPSARFDDLADRVLSKIRDLPDRRDLGSPLAPSDAEIAVHAFAADVERLAEVPGFSAFEASLRTGLADRETRSAWLRITGGSANALLDEIATRRAAWFDAWGVDGTRADRHRAWLDAARLWIRYAEPIVALAGARDALRDGRTTPGVDWPGWELSEDAAEALLRPAEATLLRAATALVTGEAWNAEAALRALEAEHAGALVAGRVELALAGTSHAGGDELDDALRELALGPPDPELVVLGRARDELVAVSRWAEELAAGGAVGAVLNASAQRALRVMAD
jgi:hypothetical protein